MNVKELTSWRNRLRKLILEMTDSNARCQWTDELRVIEFKLIDKGVRLRRSTK